MIDREVVELLSNLSKKLAFVKKQVGDLLNQNKITTKEYEEIRNNLNDCQFNMATYCDCAPIKLMTGDVDAIVANFDACEVEIDL